MMGKLAALLASCALVCAPGLALAQSMPQTYVDVNNIPHNVVPVWCLGNTCSGGGGGSTSIVYGQNGTSAMSPTNPFAVAPGTGITFPVTDNGGSLTVDTGTAGLFIPTDASGNSILGNVGDAAYAGGASGSLNAILKGIYANTSNTNPNPVIGITQDGSVPTTAQSAPVLVGGTSNGAANGTAQVLQVSSAGAVSTLGAGGFTSAYGAVTTAAPTYTTGQSNSLSLNTSGGLRVDGSGVTQPVNGAQSNSGAGVTGSTNVPTNSYLYGWNGTAWAQSLADASGRLVLAGAGTAGTPAGGVLSVQGSVAAGTAFTGGTTVAPPGLGGWTTVVGGVPTAGTYNAASVSATGALTANIQASGTALANATSGTGATGTGSLAVAEVPVTSQVSPTPSVQANTSGYAFKTSAGNWYGYGLTNTATSSVAGWLVLNNTTAVPAANAALTPSLPPIAVAANTTYYARSPYPVRCSTGCTLLFSTSQTNYVAPSVLPSWLGAEVQ